MLTASLLCCVLSAAPASPADGAVVKEETPRAPAGASPVVRPPPDIDDARDAPVPVVVGPSPDDSLMAVEQDLPGLLAQVGVHVGTAAACWAFPGALVAVVAGGSTALLALLVPALWPLVVMAPLLSLPCLVPGCVVGVPLVSVASTLLGQFFTGRRGPILQPAAAAWLAATVLGVVVVLPLVLATVGLGSWGLAMIPWFLSMTRGDTLAPMPASLVVGFAIAAMAYPVLAAAWIMLSGVLTRVVVGAMSAGVFRQLGRHLDPREDATVDLFEVGPPPPEELPSAAARPPSR